MRLLILKLRQYLNGKGAVLAFGIAAFALVGNLLLAASYLMEVQEQRVLISEIAAARGFISEYSHPLTTQRLLAKADVALAAEQNAFHRQISNSEVAAELLSLARAQNLTVTETSTQPGQTREVGQHSYQALSVVVQVAGTGEALRAFLRELEKGALPGARINEVNISDIAFSNTEVSNGRPENSGINSSEQTMLASLAISVYERQEGAD